MPPPHLRRGVRTSEDLHMVFGDILFETDEITLLSKNKKNNTAFDSKLFEALTILDEISHLIKDNDYMQLCNILLDLKTLAKH